MGYRLSRTAQDHVDAILATSAREHGLDAAGRYHLLILAAVSALADRPARPGSRQVQHVPGVRAYPLRFARQKVEVERRVGTPRHLIVYRVANDGTIDVLGLAHDRMVLSRAARRAVRMNDNG